MSRSTCSAVAVALLLGLGGPAAAQDVDIEVPVVILEEGPITPGGGSGEIDLANIVQTAARALTTIQEAPAIVTVITGEEMRERGFTTVEEVADAVPGWLRIGAIYNQFPFLAARGIIQSSLYMVNGVSMFDPNFNVATVHRVQPIETIKRIEMVTGPGGVLWGANSYLGIVNTITKDAEDVDGVEADVGAGTGNGDRDYLRGYVMAGLPELWSDSSKLFIHSSFETYVGPGYELPFHMFSQPLPNPNSITLYGPLTQANPPRSMMFNFDGKLTIGALSLTFSAPLVERHLPNGFPGFVTNKNLREDTAVLCLSDADDSIVGAAQPGNCPTGTHEGGLACPNEQPYFDPNDFCLDKGRKNRDDRLDFFDRYLIADYRTRLAGGKAGLAFKGYFTQFVRNFRQLGILGPVPGLLEGGLAFHFNGTNYRTGGAIDGDIDLPADLRLLYGVEAFHEWNPDRTTTNGSRQGAGTESRFDGPYQLERLPFLCPRTLDDDGNVIFVPECPLTFAFDASRTVMGAYANPQWKASDKLILDAGARVQVAPGSMGNLSYPVEPLFSGALVYDVSDWLPGGNWHTKVNYTEGFRPPVFNNTNSNGDSVQIDGRPDLAVERSQAGQVEINGRLFKGDRRLRELNFRADYSYTKLENLIQVVQGRYENTADRGIHSVEVLGKLYLEGGHRVELGYTWLQMITADKGMFRSLPEHWFNLAGIFQLSDSVTVTTAARVLGALEDPNRIVEYRDYGYNDLGRVVNCGTTCTGGFDNMGTETNLTVQPHEMVLDRLPPSADLTVGIAYTGIKRLRLAAFAYNALNARYYQPDSFFDYEPRLEFVPLPAQDFRFQVHASYSY